MKKRRFPRFLFIVLGFLALSSWAAAFWRVKTMPKAVLVRGVPQNPATDAISAFLEPKIERVEIKNPVAAKIVAAAHAQEGDAYNASYKPISYPNGDVPRGGGACTDVIVRSLRAAGYDLQKLIHEDMKRDFGRYPDPWKLGHTDKNIDHRRVPNQMAFFQKYGAVLSTEVSPATLKIWQPGDIVVWKMDDGRWHTGIISDGIGEGGVPMVIHNAWECIEQDYLREWQIMGHYRFPSNSHKRHKKTQN